MILLPTRRLCNAPAARASRPIRHGRFGAVLPGTSWIGLTLGPTIAGARAAGLRVMLTYGTRLGSACDELRRAGFRILRIEYLTGPPVAHALLLRTELDWFRDFAKQPAKARESPAQ
jgi:hypothetical protein